jgi:hypothetical protein
LGSTNGQIQLFKNGGRIDSDRFLFNGMPITPGDGKALVRFGKGSGDYVFKGAIDNVRFYNRVLNQQDVTNLLNDQTP